MYQVIYEKSGQALTEKESILVIKNTIIRIEKEFINTDILKVEKLCRDLEKEMNFPLRSAYFDEEELVVIFNMESCSVNISSMEKFNLYWYFANEACLKVLQDIPTICWKIIIPSIDERMPILPIEPFDLEEGEMHELAWDFS